MGAGVGSDGGFDLTSAPLRPIEQRLAFGQGGFSTEPGLSRGATIGNWAGNLAGPNGDVPASLPRPDQISDLKPLGQVSSSFIVAVNGDGLWLRGSHRLSEKL